MAASPPASIHTLFCPKASLPVQRETRQHARHPWRRVALRHVASRGSARATHYVCGAQRASDSSFITGALLVIPIGGGYRQTRESAAAAGPCPDLPGARQCHHFSRHASALFQIHLHPFTTCRHRGTQSYLGAAAHACDLPPRRPLHEQEPFDMTSCT